MSDVRQVPRLSIILPLGDFQHLGMAALQSTLRQGAARSEYELVLVRGDDTGLVEEGLLAQSDRIAPFAGALEDPDNRSRLYIAGARMASGRYLFFMEGHTLLHEDACARMLGLIDSEVNLTVASAYPSCGSITPLGQMADAVNRKRQAGPPPFAFGGQSLVCRRTFLELSEGLETLALYAERAMDRRLHSAGGAIVSQASPFCTHFNDYPAAWWCDLLTALGRLPRQDPQIGALEVASPWFARLLLLGPLQAVIAALGGFAGRALIHGAGRVFAIDRALGERVHAVALRLLMVSGYCRRPVAGHSRPIW